MDPTNIKVNNIPGLDQIIVRWVVDGRGKYTIKIDSKKGGLVTITK
jgi:hypothetical protein